MFKLACQVIINRPKYLFIIGLVLVALGLSWFSGGPIKEVLAQSPPTCQPVEILPEANKSAVDQNTNSVRQVNVNALNVKLTCKEIVNVWKTLLGATDIVVALYLIAIAVATIFHIQYDTYSIKKTLPPLIVGVILANFSLFITRVMVDFASVLAVTFINAEGGQSQFLKKLIEGIFGNFGGTIGAYINSSAQDTPLEAFGVMFELFKFLGGAVGLVLAIPLFFIGLIFTIVPAILIFFLALLFYARYYIVIALAVVSPLAFICMAFTPTQKYFQRWWQEAIKWVFMLPVSMFLLWLAIQMNKLVAGDNASIGSYLVSLIFLYLAIKVPFSWGTLMGVGVMAGVYGLTKTLGGRFGQGIQVGAGTIAQRAQLSRKVYQRRAGDIRGSWGISGRNAGERRSSYAAIRRGLEATESILRGRGLTSDATLVANQITQLDREFQHSESLEQRASRSRRISELMGYAFIPDALKKRIETGRTGALRAGLKTEKYARGAGPLAVIQANRDVFEYVRFLDIESTVDEAGEYIEALHRAGLWRTQQDLFNLIRMAVSESDDFKEAYMGAALRGTRGVGAFEQFARQLMYFNRRLSDRPRLVNALDERVGRPLGVTFAHAVMDESEEDNQPSVVQATPNTAARTQGILQQVSKQAGMINLSGVQTLNVQGATVAQIIKPKSLRIADQIFASRQQALLQALGKAGVAAPERSIATVNNAIRQNIQSNQPIQVEPIAQRFGMDPKLIEKELLDYDAATRTRDSIAAQLATDYYSFSSIEPSLEHLMGQLQANKITYDDLQAFLDTADQLGKRPA